MNISPVKVVPRLFLTKHDYFSSKTSKLHSSHYGNISEDPLVIGRGSLRIRGSQFGKYCYRASTVLCV